MEIGTEVTDLVPGIEPLAPVFEGVDRLKLRQALQTGIDGDLDAAERAIQRIQPL